MTKRKQRKIDVEVRKVNQKVYNLRRYEKRFGLPISNIPTIRGASKQSYKDLKSQVNVIDKMVKQFRGLAKKSKKSVESETLYVKGVKVSHNIASEYLYQVEQTNKLRDRLGRQAYKIALETGEIGRNVDYEEFYRRYAGERGFQQESLKSKVLIKGQEAIDQYFIQSREYLRNRVKRTQTARDNLIYSIDQVESMSGSDDLGMDVFRKLVKEMSDKDFDLFIASFEQVQYTFRYNDISYSSSDKDIWDMLDKAKNVSVFKKYFSEEDEDFVSDLLQYGEIRNDTLVKYGYKERPKPKYHSTKEAMKQETSKNEVGVV